MTKLSVSVNKIAILRNAHGGNVPDVVKIALDCESFGADGITTHPRPDERHVRRSDVYNLRPLLRTGLSTESYPPPEFIGLVLKVKSHQIALVPGDPSQITSDSGRDTRASQEFLTEVLDQFNSAGIHTSAFVVADPKMVEHAVEAGADRVELYTEPYATDYSKNPEAVTAPFTKAVKTIRKLDIGLSAGHDLNLMDLNYLYKDTPWMDEVSIEYVLVSDALYPGLECTIQECKNCLRS